MRMRDADRQRAFEQLMRTYLPALRRLARSYTRGPAEQEDLLQEIALGLWMALPQFRGEASERTWLYRVALNVAISQQRRERHRAHVPLDEAHDDVVGEHDVDAEFREQLESLQRAMQALNAIDRALLQTGNRYVFQIQTVRGRPKAAMGDFATVAYPQSIATIFTRAFSVK